MKFKNIYKLSALMGVMALASACTEDKISTVDINGLAEASDYTINVLVNDETNQYTITLNNYEGVYPVWTLYGNPNDLSTPSARSTNQVFTGVIRKAGDYLVEARIGNRNGFSEGVISANVHISKDLGGGNFTGYKYDSEFNMWKNANVVLQSTWFANNDWGELNPQPEINFSTQEFSFHTPGDMGNSQWQGQVHVGTDIPVSSAELYDFSVYIESQVDANITVKVQKDGDDGTFFSESQQPFKAGGDVYYFSGLPGFDGTLKIAFDFAGYPDTDFVVSNIVFKNHNDDDGTVFPVYGFTYDQPDNLWKNATISDIWTYFANNDWGGINDPAFEIENQTIYVSNLPAELGTQQWQGQLGMNLDIATSSANTYDFSVVITATADHSGITVKLTDPNDDNHFMTAERVKVQGNQPYLFGFTDVPGLDTDAIKLVLDFGGGQPGSDVTLTDFVLIDHSLNTEKVKFDNGTDDGDDVDESYENPEDVVWDGNLWKGYEPSSFWFADEGWNQVADPDCEKVGDTGYKLTLTDAHSSRWMAQMHITTDITSSNANHYDFRITFTPSKDIPAVMVKLHPDGDDATFYMEKEVYCPAGVATTYSVANLRGIDTGDTPLVLTLDFGSNEADTELEISDIAFQVHK